MSEQQEPRLFWAGSYDLGGVLVVAPDWRTAVRKAHDDCCDCGFKSQCLHDGDWIANTVQSLVLGKRNVPSEWRRTLKIRLVEGDVEASEWKLWWATTYEDGEFVVARSREEAIAGLRMAFDPESCRIDCVTKVDGYAVIVEFVGAGERNVPGRDGAEDGENDA